MMRQLTQFSDCVFCSKILQYVRQAAAVEDSGSTVGRLPQTIGCQEELARIAPLLGHLAGARVGPGCLGRLETFDREQRQASGQLQLDLPSVPSRTFGQCRQCCQTALEMTDRFSMGRARRGILAGLEPFIDCTRSIAGAGQVMRQEFGLALDKLWEIVLEQR